MLIHYLNLESTELNFRHMESPGESLMEKQGH